MRVYKLAKEYDMVSTEFLDIIRGFDIEIKSHLSSLSDDQISLIKEKMDSVLPEEVKSFIPPPDVVGTEPMCSEEEIVAEKMGNLTQNAIDEVFHKESIEKRNERRVQEIAEENKGIIEREEKEREAKEIKKHVEEHKKEQLKSMAKPRGFFGWIASWFS